MSGMPSNIAPADIDASELPSGYTLATGAGSGQQTPAQEQAVQQRQAVLEQAMTPEALARLRRVKLVKRERASAVEAMIANMALQGKIESKITEGKLIEMLEGIVGAQNKKGDGEGIISIKRKKYAFDSDDDDDNDDDLL